MEIAEISDAQLKADILIESLYWIRTHRGSHLGVIVDESLTEEGEGSSTLMQDIMMLEMLGVKTTLIRGECQRYLKRVVEGLHLDKLVVLLGTLDPIGFGSMSLNEFKVMVDSHQINSDLASRLAPAMQLLEQGLVDKVHLIDGSVKHSTLLEIYTNEGVGMLVTQDG
jgi:hypothetical protein